MRLSRIEIENFKGIGARQVIELKPITLLFGPNSAGKSTVLQALQYAREVLERGNLDPDTTLSDVSDLGGFRSLVHGQNLDTPIRIRIDMDVGEDWFVDDAFLRMEYGPESAFDEPDWWIEEIEFIEENLPMWGTLTELQMKSFGLEFEVRWSHQKNSPYISLWTAFINGSPLASIKSRSDEGWTTIGDFNPDHEFFRAASFDEDRSFVFPDEDGETPLEAFFQSLGAEGGTDQATLSEASFKVMMPYPYLLKAKNTPDYHFNPDDGIGDRLAVNVATGLFNEWFVDAATLIKETLIEYFYVGPLRDTPTRSYRLAKTPGQSTWARGQAAWDVLLRDTEGGLTSLVNRWMSGEDRLNIPYRVNVLREKLIPVPSEIDAIFQIGLEDADLDDLRKRYDAYPTQQTLLLDDLNNRVQVSLNEVGMGVSQVLPIVVACCLPISNLLIVEQPELHLHPAVQVGLGDLFIEAATERLLTENITLVDRLLGRQERHLKRRTLIIETHSEHIILRLLRRIRETSEDELPPGVQKLHKEKLAVIYADTSDTGVTYKTLRVDDEGEFVDRWPKGFFEERAEELF